MKPEVEKALANMEKHGYKVHVFENAAEIRDFITETIPVGETVGFGGSVTVNEAGIPKALREKGVTIYHHWLDDGSPKKTAETLKELYRNAHNADNYIMSANAITEKGAMLNIDGTGNRVAALINGPRRVFIVVSQNKFTSTEEEALRRVRTIACPENARRLKRETPCAVINDCADCLSPGRMCCNAVWTWHVPRGREYIICVSPETLGY